MSATIYKLPIKPISELVAIEEPLYSKMIELSDRETELRTQHQIAFEKAMRIDKLLNAGYYNHG